MKLIVLVVRQGRRHHAAPARHPTGGEAQLPAPIPVSAFGEMAAYGHPLSGPNTMNVFATVADPAVTGALDNRDSLTDEGPLPALDWDFGETGPHYLLLAIRANTENVP